MAWLWVQEKPDLYIYFHLGSFMLYLPMASPLWLWWQNITFSFLYYIIFFPKSMWFNTVSFLMTTDSLNKTTTVTGSTHAVPCRPLPARSATGTVRHPLQTVAPSTVKRAFVINCNMGLLISLGWLNNIMISLFLRLCYFYNYHLIHERCRDRWF